MYLSANIHTRVCIVSIPFTPYLLGFLSKKSDKQTWPTNLTTPPPTLSPTNASTTTKPPLRLQPGDPPASPPARSHPLRQIPPPLLPRLPTTASPLRWTKSRSPSKKRKRSPLASSAAPRRNVPASTTTTALLMITATKGLAPTLLLAVSKSFLVAFDLLIW